MYVHENASRRSEQSPTSLPCWQRSLPGCGFGVVVDVVDSPMRQHPLLPATQEDTYCINLHNLHALKHKEHDLAICARVITANQTPRYQSFSESTGCAQAPRNINVSPETISSFKITNNCNHSITCVG